MLELKWDCLVILPTNLLLKPWLEVDKWFCKLELTQQFSKMMSVLLEAPQLQVKYFQIIFFFKKRNVEFKFYFTAVDQLEQSGIRTCMMKAVEAAAKRCQQLGA